ncbi:MAG: FISUMP domain-containing protein, partial [Bacteroidales bacterium]
QKEYVTIIINCVISLFGVRLMFKTDTAMEEKAVVRFVIVFCVFFGLILNVSCKKDEKGSSEGAIGPTATTNEATNVGQGWATLNGTVNPNNKITLVHFEYDTITEYRNKIDADPDTIADNKVTSVKVNLTGLKPARTYYFRVIAENQGGESNGGEKTFTTTNPRATEINFNTNITYGSFVDIDGNNYRTVVIGTQEWLAENLRAVKLNDGTPLSFTPDASTWNSSAFTDPGYSWYNNDSVSYGALYNWYAVSTGKLCPVGWHVPSDEEWTTMVDYLGGRETAGGKLKEAGVYHWISPNAEATNESGFTAIPAGYRYYSGSFNGIGRYGYWWTSSAVSEAEAFYRNLSYAYPNIDRSSSSKKSGMTVRCIKDK